MIKQFTLITLFIFVFASCTVFQKELAEEPKSKAQLIIDQAIKTHGGKNYVDHHIEFDFRNRHYISKRNGGQFSYERIYKDKENNAIQDVFSNDSFSRKRNGTSVALEKKKSDAYSNSINSVIYFAMLPYFLNDEAVQKKYIGTSNLKGQPYHKIQVTFQKEGGGKDHDDIYMYWIHQEKNTVDYLAYNFTVNGGGARFREAFNPRVINGIRFADYVNYKPNNGSLNVEEFDAIFEKGEMKELSRILSENIEVK